MKGAKNNKELLEMVMALMNQTERSTQSSSDSQRKEIYILHNDFCPIWRIARVSQAVMKWNIFINHSVAHRYGCKITQN